MEYFYDAIDLLKGMIMRPSFSKEETDVADFLQQVWQHAKQTVQRRGNNLYIFAQEISTEKPTLLLNSHIDTVKPGSNWTKEPFTATEEENKLYGLGSNDAGASVVSLYEAFRQLSNKEQPYNLIFLASAEEEISGKNGLESVLPILPAIDFAVVGEPTGMQPAIAEKGLMVIDCTAHGKTGHAARNEGVNAITEAINDIRWFNNFHFPKESDLLGAVKMSVTMIQAGTQHNVIPDQCKFTVDIRTNECYSNEEVFHVIQNNVNAEIVVRGFRLNSSHTPLDHPFLSRANLLELKPFGSPTLSDQALMSFPSVKIGPGDSSRSHTADEYILLSEIREAIELYVRLLDGLQF